MKKKSNSISMDDLLKIQNIQYIDRTQFSIKLKEKQKHKSQYYQSNRDEFDILEKQFGTLLEQRYLAPSEIRSIDETLGYGLFSTKDIAKNELIGEYCGTVQRARRSKKMKDSLGGFNTDYSWTYPVKKGLFLLEVNARLKGNELRFVNHSFEPNLRMEHLLTEKGWILFMVSEKSIKKGEQFTIDYGEEYWVGGKRELVIF